MAGRLQPVQSMRMLSMFALVAFAGCAGRYHAGTTVAGTAIVQPRTTDLGAPTAAEDGRPWVVGSGVELPAGRYEVAATFDLPRPQRVEWTLACRSGAASGVLGESLDGPGRVIGTAQLVTTARGACALTATTDDANVIGTFTVRRAAGPVIARVQTFRAQEYVFAAGPAAPNAPIAPIYDAPPETPLPPRRPKIDKLQRRLDIALRTRAQLQYYFQTLGAVARPPMPDALAETAGPSPYDGAVWTPGAWAWKDGAWQWTSGTWGEPDKFSPSETDVADNADDWGEDYWVSLDDHITNPPPDGEHAHQRDFRGHGNPRNWRSANTSDGAVIRDHRDRTWRSPDHPNAKVRDHRDADRGSNAGMGGGSNDRGSSDANKSNGDNKDYGGVRFGRP